MIFESLADIGSYAWNNEYNRDKKNYLESISINLLSKLKQKYLATINITQQGEIKNIIITDITEEFCRKTLFFRVPGNQFPLTPIIKPFFKNGDTKKEIKRKIKKLNLSLKSWKLPVISADDKQINLILNQIKPIKAEIGVLAVSINGEYFIDIFREDKEIYNKVYDLHINRVLEKYTTESICSICGLKTTVYGNVNPISFYTVDKENYAPNFKRENCVKIYPVCKRCAENMIVGYDYAEFHFQMKFIDIDALILPRIITMSQIDFYKSYKNSEIYSTVVNILKSYDNVYKEIKKKAEQEKILIDILSTQTSPVTYNWLFFNKNNSQMEILSTAVDVPPSKFLKIKNAFDATESKYGEFSFKTVGEIYTDKKKRASLWGNLFQGGNVLKGFPKIAFNYLKEDFMKNIANIPKKAKNVKKTEYFLVLCNSYNQTKQFDIDKAAEFHCSRNQVKEGDNFMDDLKKVITDKISRTVEETIPLGISQEEKVIAEYFILLGFLSVMALSAQANNRGEKDLFSQPFVKEFSSLRFNKYLASHLERRAFQKILQNKGKLQLIDEIILHLLKKVRIETEKYLPKRHIANNARYFIYGLQTCKENLYEWEKIINKNKKNKEVS